MTAAGLAAVWACPALAQMAPGNEPAGTGSVVHLLAAKLELAISRLPDLMAHLARLPEIVGGRTALILIGIVVAGLAAEYIVRRLLRLAWLSPFIRMAGEEGARGFGRAIVLDLIALVALWIAARLVVAPIGADGSIADRLGHLVFLALVYWQAFNLVLRAWLRPNIPSLRLVPVDDATARSLLTGLNLMIILPLVAENLGRALSVTGASREATTVAVILYVPVLSAALLAIVWYWRREMAAWLTAMVAPTGFARQLKLDAARNWWMAGLVFYLSLIHI